MKPFFFKMLRRFFQPVYDAGYEDGKTDRPKRDYQHLIDEFLVNNEVKVYEVDLDPTQTLSQMYIK